VRQQEPVIASTGSIELRDVSKSYREGATVHVVLDSVDARVAPGEFVVLLGRSGSGKSTLLNLIGGIDAPSSGSVIVDGVALERLNEQERTLFRRERIGFVFQFFNLVPTLTVEENLLLPLELQGHGGTEAARAAGDLLDRVGLAGRGASFPDRLSGGERQRVAIARALIADPPLILADEPTGNLDLETGQQVLGLLERLVRSRGRTMLMATHSREVAALADRILTIRDGQLVEADAVVQPR
jgi:putative ABC transport system ATP-binding protein